MPNKYFILVIIFSTLAFTSIKAQVDTEFWFVAPAVIQAHGDAPIAFRVTALDQPATVTLSMPADPSFTPKTLSLSAYQQGMFEFTNESDINFIENQPADQINTKGILITSDNDITVYYEVANKSNPDKFTLKGENALGTEFFASSQTDYANKSKYNPRALEKIDIVATEDGTVVEITPTETIVGHSANVNYSITLNKGQSYSIQAPNDDTSVTPAYSLNGTYIKSNKNIAVTISDDSVIDEYGASWDLIGDQTIPVTVAGDEYIAMFSGAPQKNSNSKIPIQKVYILATEDNTTVTIDKEDTSTASYTLNKGESLSIDIPENTTATIKSTALHIKSTAPIYVYQLSGLVGSSNELGSAILPPIKCTGSSSVTFTRVLNSRFFIQILTQYKNIDGFNFTGPSSLLSSAKWKKVPNTGLDNDDNTWYFINERVDGLGVGTPYTLSNSTGLFHLSVFDENSGSASFGYFSAFNSLKIDGPTEECAGEVIQLKANESLSTYNWFSEKTKNEVLSTDPNLDVTESGLYWVVATRMINSDEGCELTDSVEVEFKMPEFDLGNDAEICYDDSYVITPSIEEGTFEWQDGSTGKNYTYTSTTDGTDEIWLQITDEDGCSAKETIKITTLPKIPIDLNVDVTSQNSICTGSTVFNSTPLDSYEWRFADKTSTIISREPNIKVYESGWYFLTATQDECSSTDSIEISLTPLPSFSLNDEILCHDETYTSPDFSSNNFSYDWRTVNSGITSTSKQISLNKKDSIYVKVTDNSTGCTINDSARITFREETTTLPKTVTICAYTDVSLKADELIIGNYSWEFNGSQLSESGQTLNLVNILKSQEGNYTVTGIDKDGCTSTQVFTVNVMLGDPIDLGNDKSICDGESATLSIGSTPASAFKWFNQNPETNTGLTPVANSVKYTVNATGFYYVMTTHANGCYSVDSVKVTVNPLPNINLGNDIEVCQGLTQIYDAGAGYTYEWQDGSTSQTYTATSPQEISVTITDNNGCVNSDVTNYSWKNVNIFSNDTIVACNNVPYTINTDISISNISWEFFDGSTTTDLNNNSASYTIPNVTVSSTGKYIVTADENGCTNVKDTINLYVLDPGSINLGDSPRNICEGDTIQLNANTGFNDYKWYLNEDFSEPESTKSYVTAGKIEGLTSEKWTLQAEHNSGCPFPDVSVTVEKVRLPEFTLTDNIEPCANSTVALSDLITDLNSNSNYLPPNMVTYYWNNSETPSNLEDIEITESGTYTVKIENSNMDGSGIPFACYSSAETTVNFHEEFFVPGLFDQFICQGATTDLITPDEVKNYSELQSYQWDKLDSDDNIESSNTPNQDWLTIGDEAKYALMVTYTDESCVASDTMSLITKENPIIDIQGDNEICQGDTTTFYANPSSYQSYLWSTGSVYDTTIVSIGGSYELTVEGFNGCSTTESINLTVNELPIITLNTSSLAICEGTSDVISVESVKSNGNDAVNPSYLWNNWKTSNSITVTEAGNYSVDITDDNGCTNQAEATVIKYPQTQIDLSSINTTGCSNEGILLTCPLTIGTDITSYQWAKSETTSENPAADTDWRVYESGTYILTIIDNNLCEESDSVQITIYESPSIDLGSDKNLCVGEELSIPTPENYSSYTWNTGSTESSIEIATSGSPVNYSVTVYDDNGCYASDDINITPIPLPVVTLPEPQATCPGIEVELTPQIINKPASYSIWWSSNSDKETITVGAGTYTVSVTDIENGCSGSAETQVTWYEAPKVTLGSDTLVCPLIEIIPISPYEGDIYKNYLWHNNLTSYEINGDIGYINTVQVTDEHNCSTFDQQKIQYMSVEDSTYTYTICEKDTTISLFDIDPESDSHTGEYLWLSDNSTLEYKEFLEEDTAIVNVGITIDNNLTTCYFKQDTVIMNYYPLPQIEVLDTSVYRQVAFEMDMVNPPYEYSLDSLYWQSENLFTDLDEGEYTAYIIDNNGCVNSETFNITDALEINIPNFFTPNFDGYNDTWEIEGIEKMPDSNIRIYDRYGKLLVLYKASDPGWDGTYHNRQMPSTDYWYVVEILPTKKLLKGHFTLKR